MSKGREKSKKGFRMSLVLRILMISVLPVAIISIALTLVGVNSIQGGMQDEVMEGLKIQLENLEEFIEDKDAGDYRLDVDNNVYKGQYNITANSEELEKMVENTGLDVTFAYGKTRRATTVRDSATGQPAVGTDISDEVCAAVLDKGEEFHSYDAMVNGEPYYAYYAPAKNSNGEVVGIFFAGKPQATVTEYIQGKSITMIAVALVICLAALAIVVLMVISIRKAIAQTNKTIITISEGDLTTEIDKKLLSRGDELGDMARAVNTLSEQLVKVMTDVKNSANVLDDAGKNLNTMAAQTSATADEIGHAVEDISKGAVSQAEEIENASSDIEQMGGMIERIVDKVGVLDNTSDEMKAAGDSSSDIIQELSQSNDRTMDAIHRIGEQVNATNESANMISEAIQLITSIAEETNLLSLNASIEAARAGEQGKGFAVVANQIQKLAEQSNESAQKVSEIIANLLKDSEKTVAVMDEVQVIVNEQQAKLNQTKNEFSNVQTGIYSSREETSEIKNQTGACDSARVRVVDVISNLSAISEENAAATEETTASMQELNATINLFAESASHLTDLSSSLAEEIKFFKL